MNRPMIRLATAALSAMLVLSTVFLVSCRQNDQESTRLGVMTSIFPMYDMARAVGGSDIDLELLTPPGTEAHTFEPTPGDIVRLEGADVFIYNGADMEPWVDDILAGIKNTELLVVDTSRGVTLRTGNAHDEEADELSEGHEEDGHDPHIWLDVDNAKRQVDAITAAFEAKDAAHAADYRERAETYKGALDEIDALYREGLGRCETDVIVSSGHFAFGYLAARYGFTYTSVYGLSPDAEPTPRRIAEIIDLLKQEKIRYLFAEEMIDSRLTESIREETGAEILYVSSGHEVTKDRFDGGITLPDIMKANLDEFKRGLSCQ